MSNLINLLSGNFNLSLQDALILAQYMNQGSQQNMLGNAQFGQNFFGFGAGNVNLLDLFSQAQ